MRFFRITFRMTIYLHMNTIVKIRDNFQVTLPAEIRRKFKMKIGGYVDVEDTKKGILIRPVKVVRSKKLWPSKKK